MYSSVESWHSDKNCLAVFKLCSRACTCTRRWLNCRSFILLMIWNLFLRSTKFFKGVPHDWQVIIPRKLSLVSGQIQITWIYDFMSNFFLIKGVNLFVIVVSFLLFFHKHSNVALLAAIDTNFRSKCKYIIRLRILRTHSFTYDKAQTISSSPLSVPHSCTTSTYSLSR